MPYSLPKWSRRRQRAGVNYWPRRTSAGVAVFSPLSLSPALWLKADAGTLQTVGGSAASADGDPVGQLLDQSGNGKHGSQAIGSFRPTLRLAVQNGLPVLRFDGADDFLDTLLTSLNQPATVLLVAKKAGISNTVPYSGSNSAFLYNWSGTTGTQYAGANLNFNCTPTSWNTYCSRYNLAASSTRVNGVQTSGDCSSNNFGTVSIGALSGGFFWDGDIGEILFFNSALPDADCASLEAYARTRWGTP